MTLKELRKQSYFDTLIKIVECFETWSGRTFDNRNLDKYILSFITAEQLLKDKKDFQLIREAIFFGTHDKFWKEKFRSLDYLYKMSMTFEKSYFNVFVEKRKGNEIVSELKRTIEPMQYQYNYTLNDDDGYVIKKLQACSTDEQNGLDLATKECDEKYPNWRERMWSIESESKLINKIARPTLPIQL